MDYKVLYRKYRPNNFDELVGQDAIKEVLTKSIINNKIAHAYIFTGPRGTGKTSTAKIFAKTLNCLNNNNGVSCDKCEMCVNYNESPDIIEIDAASNNGVEEIRTLRDSVKIAPYSSKYKVYIIDEVHMLSNSAWNAFLKTLEEPPSHVIFILATTEINKIPDTVKSRCQIFNFNKIDDNAMGSQLEKICKSEKILISSNAINELIKLSNGCLRDALSALDRLSKFDREITVDLIKDNFGIVGEETLDSLYNYIKSSNIDLLNKEIDLISKTGVTPLNFINEFINSLLNKVILKKITSYEEINLIKTIINKLNSLISNFNSVINPYLLIKIELITLNYFPGNNFEIKNDDIKTKEKKDNNVVLINETKEIKENSINIDNFEKLKKIRINNSFVDASKEYKKDFQDSWNKFIDKNTIDNSNILGYIENLKTEVVSSTNVIFSTKNESDALIINSNIENVEKNYNDFFKSNYKFIVLSSGEWNTEKKDYIANKDKEYKYIEELDVIDSSTSELENLANDIFGDNIIEVR